MAVQQGRRRVETGGVPSGHVEDFGEPRTKLADFFSIRLILVHDGFEIRPADHLLIERASQGRHGRFPDLPRRAAVLRLFGHVDTQRIGQCVGNRNGHDASDHDGS